MKSRTPAKLILVSLFLLLKFNSYAQFSLDTIEISTGQIPVKSSNTGRNITVLKAAQIDKMIFSSMDDLLQRLPGIEVQMRNAFGAQGDISMRGSTFSQVLILINGMKLNDPLTGHFNAYIPVSSGEIERIEVLRGAASSIYGADAVGGVINIITKGFGQSEKKKVKVGGELGFGSNKLINAQNHFQLQENKLFVSGGFSIIKSDGEFVEAKEIGETVLDPFYNYFDNRNYALAIGYKLSQSWSLKARASFDDRDFSARYFYTNSTFDKSLEKVKNWFNQIQVKHIGSKSSTNINLAYRRGTDEFVFSPDFSSTNFHTSQFWNFNANHMMVFNPKMSVNIGLQMDHRSIESTDRGNHSDWHSGLVGVIVYKPLDRLNLVGSGRVDYDENYGVEFTPQLNLSYAMEKLSFRASAGKSIRAADYTERFVSYNLENLTPGRSLGNPNLEAERSWSEEIGLDYKISKNWTMKSTVFSRQSDNLIDYVQTNQSEIERSENLQEGADYFYAKNISDVVTNGFEIESWFKAQLSEQMNINFNLAYTFLKTGNDEDEVSVYISSHARHLFSSNINFEWAKFGLSVSGLLKEREARFADALGEGIDGLSNTWDLKLNYQAFDNLQFLFKCYNVFDADNQDILGAKLPGRWLNGAVKFDF